jgi:pimeloyl-ACP methyl ester carboxylesterase
MNQRMIAVDGVNLHLMEAGQGDAVLLLHGFPEFWYSWRHQLDALSQAGFRAIAPDLRGYNRSGQPRSVSSYRVNTLVADMAALVTEVGSGPVHVVGHDWGGLVAWRFASLHPQLVRKLAVLNAAHPAAYLRELRRNPMQWLRSYYVLLFQLPLVPECMISARDFAALQRAWETHPVHPESFTKQDIARYKEALRTSGLTGPLNYYRAAMRYPRDLFGPPQTVSAPTLIIWGERDPFMTSAVNDRLENWVPDLTVRRIERASHWVQNDVPECVNQLLIGFLCSDAARKSND